MIASSGVGIPSTFLRQSVTRSLEIVLIDFAYRFDNRRIRTLTSLYPLISRISPKTEHPRSSRCYTQTAPSSSFDENGGRQAPAATSMLNASVDPLALSATLGYTWLTHWQLVEEDRRFRQMMLDNLRGRQTARQQHLLNVLLEGQPDSTARSDESGAASETDIETRIIDGRFSVISRGYNATQPSAQDALDELTWLASHPDESGVEEAASEFNQGSNTRAPALWSDTSSFLAGDKSNVNVEQSSGVLPQGIQLRIGGEVALVRPLWLCVFVEDAGSALLFESLIPLDQYLIDKMTLDVTPFCRISGLQFGALADVRQGPWLSFFVGLVGGVAPEEADILWPNQVLHRDRVLYNVRNAADVARFLADPRREDVEDHLSNLRRLADERGYRRGWCWHMLRTRWGEGTLRGLGMEAPPVQR